METKTKLFSTKSMAVMALFTAITCVVAPFSIPIGPVPISLTNFILYISAFVLGWKRATITCVLYLILGTVGLPVFSGFAGGLGKVAGPTGGYLVGFIFMTMICGLFIEKGKNIILSFVGMILGTIVAYALGTAWFCFSMHVDVIKALSLCVFPFIIGDLIKIAIAGTISPKIAKEVKKLGV